MNYFDRFLATTLFNRLFIIISIWLLSAAVAYQILDTTYHKPRQARILEQEQLRQEIAALENKLEGLTVTPPPATVKSAALDFSLADFVIQSGGKLLAWRPTEQQAVLELSLPWERVSSLFEWLTRYRRLGLKALNLKGEGERVIATLTLELSNETI